MFTDNAQRDACVPKKCEGNFNLEHGMDGKSPAGRRHVHDPNPSFSLDWKSGRNNQWMWTFFFIQDPGGPGPGEEGAWHPARVQLLKP